MVLIDTSVWINHLRHSDGFLASLSEGTQIVTHPFVLGELACGNLKNRTEVFSILWKLPIVSVATDPEVLFFIEERQLMGSGIGYVDAHLLTATAMDSSLRLWTHDKSLRAVAKSLGLCLSV